MMTTEVPFFDEAEQHLLSRSLDGRKLGEFGQLVCVAEDAEHLGDNIELLSALFLTTNLLLMGRSSRRLIKNIELNATNAAANDIYPSLNAARYYCAGEFSRIDNFRAWYGALSRATSLSQNVQDRLEEVTDFLTGSELAARDAGKQNAETLLSVNMDGKVDHQGLVVGHDNPFFISATDVQAGQTAVFPMGKWLTYSNFVFGSNFGSDVVVMKMSCTDFAAALEQWSSCVEDILIDRMIEKTT